MCSLSKEQSILSRETNQNVSFFFFRIMPFFRLRLFILYQAPLSQALAPTCGAHVSFAYNLYKFLSPRAMSDLTRSLIQFIKFLFRQSSSTAEECKYPDLFSTITSRCESFIKVNCETRPEPQAPCKYMYQFSHFDYPCPILQTRCNC